MLLFWIGVIVFVVLFGAAIAHTLRHPGGGRRPKR